MALSLTGKIIAVLQSRSGTSQRTGKEWVSQEFVLETQEQYPQRLCFTVSGAERLRQFSITEGETLTVFFDIDAHEWNGRWYNEFNAYNVRRN